MAGPVKNAKDISDALKDTPGLREGDPAIYAARAGYVSEPSPAPAEVQAQALPLREGLRGYAQDPAMLNILKTEIPGVTYPTTGVREPTSRDILRQLWGGGYTPSDLQAQALEAERAQNAKWYR
jgi:hypothetical protein